MTEPTCPTCGGKCRTELVIELYGCRRYSYTALPQPDLTKLREITQKYSKLSDIFATANCMEVGNMYYHIAEELWQTVKELLEDNHG